MSIRVLFVASSVVLVLTADNVAVHETFAFDEKSNVRPIFVAGHQDGWTILGKYIKAYKVIGGKKTWAEADKTCKSKGAQLASIMNKEENDFIWELGIKDSVRDNSVVSFILVFDNDRWPFPPRKMTRQAPRHIDQYGSDIAKSVSERTGREGRIWIGGKKKCGSWKWTDGTKWDYENWDSGEPNNEGGHEDCLQILAHPQRKGKWNDAPCDGKLAFVCEK